ncbi:MAG TPA: transposase [Pseudomonas sp.]|mgnify:CR=1 FL=1|nr:transposase [Pseudomonas sp.]
MPNYRRARAPGATYFFTVNLWDRSSDLLVRHIDLLREAVGATRARHPFRIDAWVVLPDHMHCLWTLPPGDADFAVRWQVLKYHFSRRLPLGEPRTLSNRLRNERGIWQRRYWEHQIRDEEDFRRHADYIHINPLKHGHVTRVVDWPYSTFHRAVRGGMYAPDWAAGEVDGGQRTALIPGDAGERLERQP